LLQALHELASRSCELEADLLAHLGEVDARELYLGQGFPSMFSYCTGALHFSEGTAYHRIAAARAARSFAILLDCIRRGELHLAAVRLLAPHLTPENHVELIANAKHKSKRAIEEMLADRAPKPDAPALVRRVPVPPTVPVQALFTGTDVSAPASWPRPPEASTPSSVLEPRPEPSRSCPQPEPLGAQRYKVQFTADAGTRAKLREAQALLRHRIPDGDLAAIFDLALSALLREVRRSRFATTDRPRTNADAQPAGARASRHIPAAVRREVAQRDGGRCTFIAATGRCCDSRDALEFHHTEPFAMRPRHSLESITLRCRAHNRHAAAQDFGAEHMGRFRKQGGAAVNSPRGELTDSGPDRRGCVRGLVGC
jgi:hypothetical protein